MGQVSLLAALDPNLWNVSPLGLGLIAARTTLVFFVTYIGLRMSGKREVGQMTPYDLVVLLLISNAVQNAMTGPDVSLSGGIVAAVMLLLLNRLASYLSVRSPTWRRLLIGQPRILVKNGSIQYDALKREQMTEDELLAELREREVADLSDVALATLEVDGEVSVIRQGESAQVNRGHRRRLTHHHKH